MAGLRISITIDAECECVNSCDCEYPFADGMLGDSIDDAMWLVVCNGLSPAPRMAG